MVPWAHTSPELEFHLDWFSHFAGLTAVTDRQSESDRPRDHATRSVRVGLIYVRSTAMQSVNNKKNVYVAVIMTIRRPVKQKLKVAVKDYVDCFLFIK